MMSCRFGGNLAQANCAEKLQVKQVASYGGENLEENTAIFEENGEKHVRIRVVSAQSNHDFLLNRTLFVYRDCYVMYIVYR